MSNENKARLAHELLDEINAREDLTPRQVGVLRSFLPERPKINTLEDVYREVCNAWYRTDGNVWKAETFGELEDWLRELHEQLKGLIDAQPTAPALPAGMRLAEHEEYGRVVVSPKPNDIGQYRVFYLDNFYLSGADASYVEADALTFIAAAPELAQALAEETYEYGVEYKYLTNRGAEWRLDPDVGWHKTYRDAERAAIASVQFRIVRRRVSPPEVINE